MDIQVLNSLAIILGGTILFIQNYRKAKDVHAVKTDLTQNNGGSSTKDRLDAIDKRLFRIESVLMGRKTKQ